MTLADCLVRRLRDVEPLRAEWVALARRYVAIRGSVSRAENLLPDQAKGYKAACVDAIIQVANEIWAMLVLMGDRDADLRHDDPQLAGAEGLLSAAGARDEDHGTPDPGDVFLPRGVILPRDRWVKIGGRWKHIRDESAAARTALSQFVRKSSRVLRAADRINGSVTRARAHLETMVHAQHPDWQDAGQVFFGTTPPQSPRGGSPHPSGVGGSRVWSVEINNILYTHVSSCYPGTVARRHSPIGEHQFHRALRTRREALRGVAPGRPMGRAGSKDTGRVPVRVPLVADRSESRDKPTPFRGGCLTNQRGLTPMATTADLEGHLSRALDAADKIFLALEEIALATAPTPGEFGRGTHPRRLPTAAGGTRGPGAIDAVPRGRPREEA